MNRRQTLQIAVAAGGSLWLNRCAGASATSEIRRAPFRLWYNNDTTNILDLGSPFHRRGEPLTDAAILGSVDEVANSGVDAYAFSAGLGHIPFWKSAVYSDHYAWWMKKTGRGPDPYGAYLLAGGDMVRLVVERCRKLGMAPFISLRMNDVHHLENVGTKHPSSVWVSRFYEENPKLLLEPDHPATHPKGYYPWRGQNWACAEVRNRKLAFLTELCEGYDLAGVELDWLRDQHLFPTGFPASERVEILTNFLGQVRQLLNRTTHRGERRYLAVRIPLSVAGQAEFGFDAARAMGAGVDILNCSGWYFAQPASDLAEIRRQAPDATIFQELTHAAGNLQLTGDPGSSGYSTDTFPRTSDEMYFTAANLAYQRGADGISLFNFVYSRMGSGAMTWLIQEPPFHVLPKLRDRDWLSHQPQRYWLAPWNYLNQMQRPLKPGAAVDLRLDLALPRRKLASSARLRLICSPSVAASQLVLAANGTPLEPVPATVPSSLEYPYDRLLGDSANWRIWNCPVELLREGINTFRVTRSPGGDVVFPKWLDLLLA